MKITTIKLPAMYGDHHVQEVRRILLAQPGVEDVYASSAFRTVEISFEPGKIGPETLETILDKAGYLGELPIPEESSIAVNERNGDGNSHFRHTAAFVQTNQTVSFGQEVAADSRPLWPCPGMGPVRTMDE